MARIKVVLGERARAQEAYEADQARLARLTPGTAAREEAAAVVKAAPAGREVKVTYKKFGRKYTVPLSQAPARPTRQQRTVAIKKARYFAALKAHTADVTAAEAAASGRAAPLA